MYTSITNEQLVNFVLNDVNDTERKQIIEAINKDPEIKERYLFEKRINDVGRYINDEMTIGECCEIEELMKMDSRLYEYFESNTEPIEVEIDEEEQDVYISDGHMHIIKEQLVDFILSEYNEEYIGKYEKVSKLINKSPAIKEVYLFEKRKYDIDRYLNNEMDFGERCEIEELIKIDSRLYEHFEFNKDVDEFLETALKEQINDIHAELYDTGNNKEFGIEDDISFKKTTPVIKFNPGILKIGKWAVAASIIIAIGLSGASIYSGKKVSLEDRLYASYYAPFVNKEEHYFNSSSFCEAKIKYLNKEYNVALMLLENLPNSVLIEAEKQLYLGLTYMEKGNYESAVKHFEYLSNHPGNETNQSITEWYLGLCYLKTHRKSDAINIFNKIVKHSGYNHNEARKIIQKLN